MQYGKIIFEEGEYKDGFGVCFYSSEAIYMGQWQSKRPTAYRRIQVVCNFQTPKPQFL